VECSFSLDHYFKTLYDYIDAGYVIIPDAKVKRHIHLRHDVDLSLDYALELAKEEQKRDISATYYIMLHSSLYNPQSPEGMDIIQHIHSIGHKIGLHVDTRSFLSNDLDTLSLIVGERVTDWRKHLSNLTPDIEPEPRPKNYKYISDSGMNWREGCFCQQIGKHDKMEILTHPIWWVTDFQNQFNKIHDAGRTAKNNLTESFQSFVTMVQEYIQTVKA
jgi:hypothetical protein